MTVVFASLSRRPRGSSRLRSAADRSRASGAEATRVAFAPPFSPDDIYTSTTFTLRYCVQPRNFSRHHHPRSGALARPFEILQDETRICLSQLGVTGYHELDKS